MELKDVILSTLAEMEDTNIPSSPVNNSIKPVIQELKPKEELVVKEVSIKDEEVLDEQSSDNEMLFLTSMRERLLVLFEGFQAPNNTNLEAKIDLTLNFLEYVLVSIDSRVKTLEKESK